MPEVQAPTRPTGERMAFWLAETLTREREKVGITRAEIAQTLGVNTRTVDRLEDGDSMGRDIDHYVAGYAYAVGLDDPRRLWEEAVNSYRRHGSPPQFLPSGETTVAFAQAIRAVALRRRRDIAAPSQKRGATRNRRAAG